MVGSDADVADQLNSQVKCQLLVDVAQLNLNEIGDGVSKKLREALLIHSRGVEEHREILAQAVGEVKDGTVRKSHEFGVLVDVIVTLKRGLVKPP